MFSIPGTVAIVVDGWVVVEEINHYGIDCGEDGSFGMVGFFEDTVIEFAVYAIDRAEPWVIDDVSCRVEDIIHASDIGTIVTSDADRGSLFDGLDALHDESGGGLR